MTFAEGCDQTHLEAIVAAAADCPLPTGWAREGVSEVKDVADGIAEVDVRFRGPDGWPWTLRIGGGRDHFAMTWPPEMARQLYDAWLRMAADGAAAEDLKRKAARSEVA